MSQFDIIADHSKKKLLDVPKEVLEMCNLKMLYLEGNSIKKLPKEFFLKLHKLSWLDLRNNKLSSIPANIAYHEHLENLLLTNNRIERLPNELALVPKLKVLQVADNPITYPDRAVIAEGIHSILKYLQKQYDLDKKKEIEEESRSEDRSIEEEQEIRVVDESSSEEIVAHRKSRKHDIPVQELLRKHCEEVKAHADGPLPMIEVKGLSERVDVISYTDKDNTVQHTISKGGSKVALKSSCKVKGDLVNVNKVRNNFNRIRDLEVKEQWLNKLKKVLEEQERILQQEKNLRALGEWRTAKSTEPPRAPDHQKPEPPYATEPDYSQTLGREDLGKQIDRIIEGGRRKPRKSIERLINELVGQLKDLEGTYSEMKSPRTEIEEAGKQIKTIMELHKKLLHLQASNDSTL